MVHGVPGYLINRQIVGHHGFLISRIAYADHHDRRVWSRMNIPPASRIRNFLATLLGDLIGDLIGLKLVVSTESRTSPF